MTIFIVPKFISNLKDSESLQIKWLQVFLAGLLGKVGSREDYGTKLSIHSFNNYWVSFMAKDSTRNRVNSDNVISQICQWVYNLEGMTLKCSHVYILATYTQQTAKCAEICEDKTSTLGWAYNGMRLLSQY